ncbi:MAG: hypothetical protein DI535_20865 [Citrobacter freundii]|nr:MAG: hypothetical protein DI535_20865 [Citrobacter freundii]
MGLFSFFNRRDKPEKKDHTALLPQNLTFAELSDKAYDYLREKQQNCQSVFKLGDYKRWYYDQVTGVLTFSDNEADKLRIDFEDVGSFSLKSNTWLWAWDNPHVQEKVRSEITMVRDFGQARNFELLTTPQWEAEEPDAWQMTAIAAYLMQAKGAYRAPSSNGQLYSFFIFKTICWTDLTKLN